MQQLTQAEFSDELIRAYSGNDEELAISLIKEHRLIVKPVVNDLIKESLVKELKGNARDSQQAFQIAEKISTSFENIFGEKSLTVGISYPKTWSAGQKADKVLADSLYSVGTGLRVNEPEKAIEVYQNALEIYHNIGDERGEAEILGGFGLIYSAADAEKSMSYYRQALTMRERVDDKQLIGNSLNSIGVLFMNSGEYSNSIPYFDRAETVRSEIGDLSNLRRTQSLKASAYLSLGEEQNNAGKYSESLMNLEKALEIYQNINSKSGVSEVWNQMGFVYSNLGDYTTAIEKISDAIAIIVEENNTSGLAGAYNHLGIVLQMSGRLEKALEYFNNSLGIYEELNDQVNIIALLSNIGTLYFDRKDYLRSEEYLYKALLISREIKDKRLEANCLLNLANAQILLGKLNESESNYETGLKIAKYLNSPDLMWRFYVGMAESIQKSGEYDKAVELNDSALNLIDGIRGTLQDERLKTSYIARERFAFEGVISMLGMLYERDGSRGYDLLAYKYAELSKSRAFLDMLSESLANLNKGADNELLKSQDSIFSSLAVAKQQLEDESSKDLPDEQIIVDLKSKIKESEEELSRFKQQIRNANPKYADLKYPQPVSLEEVRSLSADKNIVFLEYSVGDSSSFLWVITPTDRHFFRLPDRKSLQEQVESIRFGLLEPAKTTDKFIISAGYSLYTQLIKPAEPYLSKKSKLVIIPDGILNYLPFEVLITENKEESTEVIYSDLPFLVKKYPVCYVQSASVLKTLLSEHGSKTETNPLNTNLIAFGDPFYEIINDTSAISENRFSRLEYSGLEIENIASFFKKGSADIYLRDLATEENVKRNSELKKYKYVHFATHGFIDEKKPDYSSLVLTPGNDSSGEDGFLRATEIFNLDMDADLVVLSACQTGLGKLVRGEGMVGLTRAFMYAGTPAVMVSLWSVSDISTATLMGEFYKNLVKGKLNKTDALRKAQLTMLKDEKFAHPFYWAPFVLFGDWR